MSCFKERLLVRVQELDRLRLLGPSARLAVEVLGLVLILDAESVRSGKDVAVSLGKVQYSAALVSIFFRLRLLVRSQGVV